MEVQFKKLSIRDSPENQNKAKWKILVKLNQRYKNELPFNRTIPSRDATAKILAFAGRKNEIYYLLQTIS